MTPPKDAPNIKPATQDKIDEARALLGMTERKRAKVPGWWVLPLAAAGIALWAAAIFAVWTLLGYLF